MTIQRRPRPQRRRRLAAALLAAVILYLVAVTAASPTAGDALSALGRQGELALSLLRSQLGDSRRDGALPAGAALAIGQSPVLLSGRTAVLALRRTDEADDTGTPPGEDGDLPPDRTSPIGEDPVLPDTPLVFADNGVEARTLVPSSPDGYIVTGDVYIHNRSSRSFDASLFDGTFAAALPEGDGPQVLILHTHATEAYTMPPGEAYTPSSDYRTTDDHYNMVRVGDEIAAALEAAGLLSVYSCPPARRRGTA